MTAQLYLAPLASGKTAWAVQTLREWATGLRRTPWVVVATPLQAQSLRRRLAAAGGALGVHVLTFDDLFVRLLQERRVVWTELAGPVRFRLLRAAIDELVAGGALPYYQRIAPRPGFIAAVESLLVELKGADVRPGQLAAALAQQQAPPRLSELALIYDRYQQMLAENGWTDRAGLGWLALAALADPAARLPQAGSPVIVDGFDSFTVVQRKVLASLAPQVETLVVLLTGAPGGALPLFAETASQVGNALGVPAQPLPPVTLAAPLTPPALRTLVEGLFAPAGTGNLTQPERLPALHARTAGDTDAAAAGADDLRREQQLPIQMIAAADRASEVRAALRWLKARLLLDGCTGEELALLTRDLSVYRDLIAQVAAEFGLPVQFAGRLPLRRNPAVAALIELLRLWLPEPQTGAPRLPYRNVIEAWRSPYFAWQEPVTGIGQADGDAERLDAVARQFAVVHGLSQWQEAFTLLQARCADDRDNTEGPAEQTAAPVPHADAPAHLAATFERFLAALTPPAGRKPLPAFVAWLEDRIGSDPDLAAGSDAAEDATLGAFTLDMVRCARAGEPALAARDLAALSALKEVLRGLVWADEAVTVARGQQELMDFARFFTELTGSIEVAVYEPSLVASGAILAAELTDVRGLPLRAVAILGLAEGDLPRRRTEDPFLRDEDRRRLAAAGCHLEPSTRSFEREVFVTALARAGEKLLLTRPRLTDSGAQWEPSPYWLAVVQRSAIAPSIVSAEQRPGLTAVASAAELLESATRDPASAAWLAAHNPERLALLRQGAELVQLRSQRRAGASPWDGYLGAEDSLLVALQERLQRWTPTTLERYRACPAHFYLAHVLRLAAREAPAEDLNVAQLGTLYHRILEEVFRTATAGATPDALLAAVPAIARRILDGAPGQEGFRVTAWWEQTRAVIEANVSLSVAALAARFPGAPVALEARFDSHHPLHLVADDGPFFVTGTVDRVDRLPDDTLCVVDYKTGVSGYDSAQALVNGERLQLPLYALAAQSALGLGQVSDGLYWFVHKGEPARWSLAAFQDPANGARGIEAALKIALAHAAGAVRSARRGDFAPRPPPNGCPEYCPAAGFCWRYRPAHKG